MQPVDSPLDFSRSGVTTSHCAHTLNLSSDCSEAMNVSSPSHVIASSVEIIGLKQQLKLVQEQAIEAQDDASRSRLICQQIRNEFHEFFNQGTMRDTSETYSAIASLLSNTNNLVEKFSIFDKYIHDKMVLSQKERDAAILKTINDVAQKSCNEVGEDMRNMLMNFKEHMEAQASSTAEKLQEIKVNSCDSVSQAAKQEDVRRMRDEQITQAFGSLKKRLKQLEDKRENDATLSLQSLQHFEEKLQATLKDNSTLREVTQNINSKLESLINAKAIETDMSKNTVENVISQFSALKKTMSADVNKLQSDNVRDCLSLRSEMEERMKKSENILKKEVANLETKISQMHNKIDSASECVRLDLTKTMSADVNKLQSDNVRDCLSLRSEMEERMKKSENILKKELIESNKKASLIPEKQFKQVVKLEETVSNLTSDFHSFRNYIKDEIESRSRSLLATLDEVIGNDVRSQIMSASEIILGKSFDQLGNLQVQIRNNGLQCLRRHQNQVLIGYYFSIWKRSLRIDKTSDNCSGVQDIHKLKEHLVNLLGPLNGSRIDRKWSSCSKHKKCAGVAFDKWREYINISHKVRLRRCSAMVNHLQDRFGEVSQMVSRFIGESNEELSEDEMQAMLANPKASLATAIKNLQNGTGSYFDVMSSLNAYIQFLESDQRRQDAELNRHSNWLRVIDEEIRKVQKFVRPAFK